MKTLSIYEVGTQISSVLLEIENTGERFVICHNGEPIADLIPHHRKSRLIPHLLISQIQIKYDPIEPLHQDEWMEAPSMIS